MRRILAVVTVAALVSAGCSSSSTPSDTAPDIAADTGAGADAATDANTGRDAAPPSDTVSPADADTASGADGDAGAPLDSGPLTDAPTGDTGDTGETADGGGDVAAPLPETPTLRAFVRRPATSLVPEGRSSCAVYQATRCASGTLQRCALWDAEAGDWAEAPPRLAEQMFWYDRYYDLYHQMEGQHTDVEFREPMPPGTPEDVWGDPANFAEHDGFGDGAGWTGTALQSAAARYAVTGTAADYERMLARFEAMMFLYEANGIPGFLMRSHFAMLEPGAPPPHGHPGKALTNWIEPDSWHFRYPLSEEMLARLPAYYTEGVTIDGTRYATTPVWMGDASRDMYVRSLPGVALAHDLLGDGEREDRLRAVVARELPCTLRRLKRIRIRNLQQNEQIQTELAKFLGGDQLRLEPGDLDFSQIDTLHGWAMEQPNPEKMELFDAACPDELPLEVEPAYDLDAAAPDFMVRFLGIAVRMQRQGDVPINWIQFPSVRGADALFLTQWALTAHALTGEERYRAFLAEMMADVDYWAVIDTMGSFWQPRWCRPHFAPSLLYPTLWNLQSRIDPVAHADYWRRLGTAIAEEYRYKELVDANDAYFGVLYQAMVDEAIDPDVRSYGQAMVTLLRGTGQYQVDDPFEPRRNYDHDVLADEPPGADAIVVDPLPDDEKEQCLRDEVVFGVALEGDIEDERPRAREGLPIPLRIGGSFQWQMDPYMLWRDYGGEGRTQWAMQGFSVAYWTGRMQGVVPDGEGLALAWRDTGEACE